MPAGKKKSKTNRIGTRVDRHAPSEPPSTVTDNPQTTIPPAVTAALLEDEGSTAAVYGTEAQCSGDPAAVDGASPVPPLSYSERLRSLVHRAEKGNRVAARESLTLFLNSIDSLLRERGSLDSINPELARYAVLTLRRALEGDHPFVRITLKQPRRGHPGDPTLADKYRSYALELAHERATTGESLEHCRAVLSEKLGVSETTLDRAWDSLKPEEREVFDLLHRRKRRAARSRKFG